MRARERQRWMFNQICGGALTRKRGFSGQNCAQFGLIWAAKNDGTCQSQV